jgi:hypothetical protein
MGLHGILHIKRKTLKYAKKETKRKKIHVVFTSKVKLKRDFVGEI